MTTELTTDVGYYYKGYGTVPLSTKDFGIKKMRDYANEIIKYHLGNKVPIKKIADDYTAKIERAVQKYQLMKMAIPKIRIDGSWDKEFLIEWIECIMILLKLKRIEQSDNYGYSASYEIGGKCFMMGPNMTLEEFENGIKKMKRTGQIN